MKIELTNSGKPLTYGELQRVLEVIISIDPTVNDETAKIEIETGGYILLNCILGVITSNTGTKIVGRAGG